jgi:hypothetical protein
MERTGSVLADLTSLSEWAGWASGSCPMLSNDDNEYQKFR